MLLNSDVPQKKEVRSRIRASTSCTECRRRKQKCNQANPCNNCSRRYPPVTCTYESVRKSSRSKEKVRDPNGRSLKVEYASPGRSEFLAIVHPPHNSRSTTPLSGIYLQLPSRPASRWSWDSSSRVHEIENTVPPDRINYGSVRDISPSFLLRQFYPYPEMYQSPYPSLGIPVGGVALEPLKYLPIEASKRHAELFQFFIQRLSSYMSSIDGNDPPPSFNNQWIPFLTHSPIAIYITILTSSYFQASTRGISGDKSVEVIGAKVKLITLINEHIASHSKGVDDDAIAAVMSLTYNELIYADERSTLAHMRGLRDMLRTRGGIKKINFPLLRMMLLKTDFQVACTYECDLFIHDDEPVPVLSIYPIQLDSPLLLSPQHFATSISHHGISSASAVILDDIRFLTSSVINLASTPNVAENHTKFLATAHWIHSRLTSCSLTSPDDTPAANTDYIHSTIHTTALIYSSAILTRTPLSLACTPELLRQLWATLWRVPLPRWKQIPGIFFWVLLVANPFARDKPEGRFLKGLMPASAMAIGLVEWDVVVGILRSFLAVQKWLGGELRGLGVIGPVKAVVGVPEGGLPEWSMSE